VVVLDGGLSDEAAELRLYQSSVLGHSSFAAPHQHRGEITTRVVRGDDWLRSLGVRTLDVMVLDVEGWEVRALDGLRRTIEASDGLRAMVEVSDWALESAGSSRSELLFTLGRLGFDVRWATEWGARLPHGVWGPRLAPGGGEPAGRAPAGDLLCIRSARP
jgi:hypothetical protein